MMKKTWVMVLVCVVIAAAFFLVGMTYGKSTAVPAGFGNRAGAFASGTRQFAGRGGAAGGAGGFVAGQVTAKDATSITLQLPNGNSEVIFYSSSTQVTKPAPASINDLAPGTNVMIGGTQNSDGSLTAESIQVREGNAPGFGGGRPGMGTSN